MSFANGFGKAPAAPVEYVFASTGPRLYEVSKFAGGDKALETYKQDLTKGKGTCDCMAWRSGKTRPCKHLYMVQEWIASGEPELGEYVCLGKGKDWVFDYKPKL